MRHRQVVHQPMFILILALTSPIGLTLQVAVERRFLHSWVEWGTVVRPVWNPHVKPCTRKMASEFVLCEAR